LDRSICTFVVVIVVVLDSLRHALRFRAIFMCLFIVIDSVGLDG
jgi:hypothetical protein